MADKDSIYGASFRNVNKFDVLTRIRISKIGREINVKNN